VSLNFQASEDGASTALQDRLVDDTPPQEQILVESQEAANGRKALAEALTLLNERERRIFVARRLAEEPSKLDELANKFGVSRERVRQIEARAFEKVRKAVKHRVAASTTAEMIPAY
jgi:RNA polymerase sigma-32 factor